MPLSHLPNPSPATRANVRNLYLDIGWYAVLAGSTLAFLSIYAARLGATGFQLGLITAGPALINMLLSLPAGRFLQGRPIIKNSFRSAIWQRFGFLALILLPFLGSYVTQVWGLLLIVFTMAVPGTLLAIAFSSLLASTVPPELRALVVGRRNAIYAVVVMVTSVTCGFILDRVAFPYGYAVVYALGGAGAVMSTYHLGLITSPDEPPLRLSRPIGRFIRGFLIPRPRSALKLSPEQERSEPKPLLNMAVIRGPFGLFMLAYLVFYTFQYVPVPLFSIFYVDDLSLSDGSISLGTAVFNAVMMLGSLWLNRLAGYKGHRFTLVAGSLFFGAYPLLLYFAQDVKLFLVASVFGGLFWAVLGGGLVNRLMERVPPDDRPAHMAVYNLVLNVGILAGSLIGPILGSWIGTRDMMLVSAILRSASGLLFLFWG